MVILQMPVGNVSTDMVYFNIRFTAWYKIITRWKLYVPYGLVVYLIHRMVLNHSGIDKYHMVQYKGESTIWYHHMVHLNIN